MIVISTKTPEQMAEEYADLLVTEACYPASKAGFLAGYKAGCEVTDQEIVDLIVDIRKREEERNKLPADKEQRYARIWEKIKVKMVGIF